MTVSITITTIATNTTRTTISAITTNTTVNITIIPIATNITTLHTIVHLPAADAGVWGAIEFAAATELLAKSASGCESRRKRSRNRPGRARPAKWGSFASQDLGFLLRGFCADSSSAQISAILLVTPKISAILRKTSRRTVQKKNKTPRFSAKLPEELRRRFRKTSRRTARRFSAKLPEALAREIPTRETEIRRASEGKSPS